MVIIGHNVHLQHCHGDDVPAHVQQLHEDVPDDHLSGLVVVGGLFSHVHVGGGACEVTDARGEAVWDQEGGDGAGVKVGEVRAPAVVEELLVAVKDAVPDHQGDV